MTERTETPASDEAAEAGDLEAAAEPQDGSAPGARQKKEYAGSYSFNDPDRPQWDRDTVLKATYDYHHADGTYAYSKLKGRRSDGEKAFLTGIRLQGDNLIFARQERFHDLYKHPGLTSYERGAGDEPDLLYRLHDLARAREARPADRVFITEGEKDADAVWALDLIATTNPNGALNWKVEFNSWFDGCDVIVLIDNDPNGRTRGSTIFASLKPIASSVRVVELPGLPENGDVSDWLAAGHTKADLLRAVEEAGSGVRLSDFHAFMPAHNYIFAPSGEPWPSTSVNARLAPVAMTDRHGRPELDDDGQQRFIAANKWLDQHQPVEQMTWAPGEPQVIKDRLISEGGWILRNGCNVFNHYRPPALRRGNPHAAGLWLDNVRRIYPDHAEHIINWLAHRVQRPQEKINHALVMGGAQGIGKDTILEPVKAAIGPWNFAEVSPAHMLGRFNGFVKSVILRVSEARDLGDVDRFAFYDHMKAYTAAPPDVLRVDEKFLREYAVFNVCGVIITSNHKTNGIFLPEDDRRHYVAWSELTKEAVAPDHWQRLWAWYRDGGSGHVAAYLADRDLSGFDPKAPPPKTEAFWDIVASNSAPEEAELNDALEKLQRPDAVTLAAIATAAEPSFGEWLRDRRNSRTVPHKMDECGYKPVRNPGSKAGRWKVEGRDAVIYARKELAARDAIVAAEKRAREGHNVVPY
jgi:hypothetical protein